MDLRLRSFARGPFQGQQFVMPLLRSAPVR